MKKSLVIFCTALLCACGLMLVACGGGSTGQSGPSDEELIAQEMEKNVKSFQEGMVQAADVLAEDESISSIFSLVNLDPKEFTNALTSKMSIETGKITVNGDKAEAEMITHAPDMNSISSIMEKTIEESLADVDLSQVSENDLYAEVGKAIIAAASSDEVQINTETIIVEYEKKNGEWQIANADDLAAAIESAFDMSM